MCVFAAMLCASVCASSLGWEEPDLFAPGTYGPSTDLEWLDVTATAGLPWLEAEVSSVSATQPGFAHATENEVEELPRQVATARFGRYEGVSATRDEVFADPKVQNVLVHFSLVHGLDVVHAVSQGSFFSPKFLHRAVRIYADSISPGGSPFSRVSLSF